MSVCGRWSGIPSSEESSLEKKCILHSVLCLRVGRKQSYRNMGGGLNKAFVLTFIHDKIAMYQIIIKKNELKKKNTHGIWGGGTPDGASRA